MTFPSFFLIKEFSIFRHFAISLILNLTTPIISYNFARVFPAFSQPRLYQRVAELAGKPTDKFVLPVPAFNVPLVLQGSIKRANEKGNLGFKSSIVIYLCWNMLKPSLSKFSIAAHWVPVEIVYHTSRMGARLLHASHLFSAVVGQVINGGSHAGNGLPVQVGFAQGEGGSCPLEIAKEMPKGRRFMEFTWISMD